MTNRWIRRLVPSRQTRIGYAFISPFILGFILWLLIPMLVSVWLVTREWDLITPPRFAGLANIQRLARDPMFFQSLKVTAYYACVSVPLSMTIAFLAALLMNSKVPGINVFRTIYYMPSIVPAVAVAVMWSWILNTQFGLLNHFLQSLAGVKIRWLQDPKWAMPALMLMSFWSFGTTMVIYLAGLQGIPNVYYEAAEMDGAGRLSKLRHVTIPLMSPQIFFTLIMGIIGSFQTFTAGYLMTGGGPENATLFYVLYLYRNGFRFFKMGYAATLAWVLFFVILGLTAMVFRGVGRRVYYAAD